MKNFKCIVLFPVYKSLTSYDLKCLEQGVAMTPGFDKAFVAPDSLPIDSSFGDLSGLPVYRFSDDFFTDIKAYSRLMLSLVFYERFKEYDYILIHQTDAYLFKDELDFWCDKGYDYIGAPWYYPVVKNSMKFRIFRLDYLPFLMSKKAKLRVQRYNNVGNGGLSLRKTSTFINVLGQVPDKLLAQYMEGGKHLFNEDIFWSIEAPEIDKNFKKPSWLEALHFSIEKYPEKAYEKIGNQLPFGCHASNIYGLEFWKKFIL